MRPRTSSDGAAAMLYGLCAFMLAMMRQSWLYMIEALMPVYRRYSAEKSDCLLVATMRCRARRAATLFT